MAELKAQIEGNAGNFTWFDEKEQKIVEKYLEGTSKAPELIGKVKDAIKEQRTELILTREEYKTLTQILDTYNESLTASVDKISILLQSLSKGQEHIKAIQTGLRTLEDVGRKAIELPFKEGGARLSEYVRNTEKATLNLKKVKEAQDKIMSSHLIGYQKSIEDPEKRKELALTNLEYAMYGATGQKRKKLEQEQEIIKNNPTRLAQSEYSASKEQLEAKKQGMLKTAGASSIVGGLAKLFEHIPGLEGIASNINGELNTLQVQAGSTEMSLAEAQKLTFGILKNISPTVVMMGLGAKAAIQIWQAFQKVSEAAVNFKREAGGTFWDIESSATFNKGLVTSVNWLETATGLAKSLSLSVRGIFTDQEIADVAQAKLLMGLTADEASSLAIRSKLVGQNAGTWRDNMTAGANASNAAHKSVISLGAVQRDVLTVSDATALSYGNGAKRLAEAAVAVKNLGLGLNDMEGISKNLISFETSISSEMEAQLMTGRHLNLEKAREYALNNNLKGVADEIMAQGIKAVDFTHMNYLQQESLAKAAGMTRDQLAKSLILRELNNGASKEALAAATKMKAEDLEAMKATEMWHEAVQKLAQSFAPILEQVSNIIRWLAKGLSFITSGVMGSIVGSLAFVASIVLTVAGGFKLIVGLGTRMLSMVKGIAGMFKGGNILGNIFSLGSKGAAVEGAKGSVKGGGLRRSKGATMASFFKAFAADKVLLGARNFAAAMLSTVTAIPAVPGMIVLGTAGRLLSPTLGKNIAGFFKAFGKSGPMILQGALYLGGALAVLVTALGVGVGLAILALTVPLRAFAWSMNALSKVDWSKLAGSGRALGSLALGLGSLVLVGSAGFLGLGITALALTAIAIPLVSIGKYGSAAGNSFKSLAVGINAVKASLRDFPIDEFKSVMKASEVKKGMNLNVGAVTNSDNEITKKTFENTVKLATMQIVTAIEQSKPTWDWLEFDKAYKSYTTT